MTEDVANPYSRRAQDMLVRPDVLEQVSDLLRAFDQATIASHTDELTKIPNRAGVIHYGDQIIKNLKAIRTELQGISGLPDDFIYLGERQVAAFSIDLVGLKRENEKAGHAAGNKLIISVAEALKATFQRDTDLYGHLGGDDFVAFAFNVKEEVIQLLTEKLLSKLPKGVQIYVVVQMLKLNDQTAMEEISAIAEENIEMAKIKVDKDENGRLVNGGTVCLPTITL